MFDLCMTFNQESWSYIKFSTETYKIADYWSRAIGSAAKFRHRANNPVSCAASTYLDMT